MPIYLNNAGTSWPKPPRVLAEAGRALACAPQDMAGLLDAGLAAAARLIGIADPRRILFTGSCTQALRLGLHDLPWREGDVALTSQLEHHALVRPLAELERDGRIRHETVPYRPGTPLDPERAETRLRRGGVRLLAFTMASNVTGELLPAAELIALAHRYDALCLVDAAQTAGVLPLDAGASGADLLAFAGHKGPLGPLGLGALYVAPHVRLRSLTAECEAGGGGGGTCALRPFPSWCDVGSANLPAVAGLIAGIEWLESQGIPSLRTRATDLSRRLREGLAGIAGVRVVGGGEASDCTGAVSVVPTGDRAELQPQALERRLLDRYGIATRGGQHCAPLAHLALGTGATGTLRLSLGPFNTADDVTAVVDALREIIG